MICDISIIYNKNFLYYFSKLLIYRIPVLAISHSMLLVISAKSVLFDYASIFYWSEEQILTMTVFLNKMFSKYTAIENAQHCQKVVLSGAKTLMNNFEPSICENKD